MKIHVRHIVFDRLALVLLLFTLCVSAWAKKPNYMLGGGGTNFSGIRKGYLDKNGLRTGQNSDVHHLFGAYGIGTYSAFPSSMPNVSMRPGGYAYGGGICYEYQSSYFKFQIGAGVAWQEVKNTIADSSFSDNGVIDARGYPYTLYYDFKQRKDQAWNLHAQVPVLFGAGLRYAYFLAGFTFDYTLPVGGTKVTAVGTTSGTYPQYLGYYVEMDNHGMRKDVPLQQYGDYLRLKFDVLATLEIGTEWGKVIEAPWKPNRIGSRGKEVRLRAALFAQYGLCDIMPTESEKMLDIPSAYKWDFPEFRMHHAFMTKDANYRKLHNFYAGIKVTVLIGFFTDTSCRLCDYSPEPSLSEDQMEKITIPSTRTPNDGWGRRRPYGKTQKK